MAKATKTKHPTDGILKELREFGLAYPGAHFKSPWPGHMDLAVNDKTFAYLSIEGEPLGISCKLPRSSEVALMLPFCKPTAYGLGKSGWVSASFEEPDVAIDVAMLKAWIDESYRAQAPKKLVASLGAPVTGESAPAEAAGKATGKTAGKVAGKTAGKATGKTAGKASAAKPAKRAAAKTR
ncbi:MAG TPA: MmcQ/YjbR family DNA-binding protein [Kofleriaceae bacterium]|nr:MmcQ/YjbR family DNA-binding protein [Kofleriaceae bacterium]